MLVIPLQSVPAQVVSVALNNQACTINIRQTTTGIYVDLLVNNALVIGGVIGQDRNRIVRSVYLGFIGDLAFVDTQGFDDPVFTGLGARWILGYFAPAELPGALG